MIIIQRPPAERERRATDLMLAQRRRSILGAKVSAQTWGQFGSNQSVVQSSHLMQRHHPRWTDFGRKWYHNRIFFKETWGQIPYHVCGDQNIRSDNRVVLSIMIQKTVFLRLFIAIKPTGHFLNNRQSDNFTVSNVVNGFVCASCLYRYFIKFEVVLAAVERSFPTRAKCAPCSQVIFLMFNKWLG